MSKEWYVLKIYSGHDKKIVPVIEQELELQGVRDLVEEIVVPTETIVEIKDGKKKEKTKNFFPGYILGLHGVEPKNKTCLVEYSRNCKFCWSKKSTSTP